MKRLFIIAALAGLAACTDVPATIYTLESAGFTDIQTTGHKMWACGKDDSYATGFVATNPRGRRVSGAVCCGMWSKGCTIRF